MNLGRVVELCTAYPDHCCPEVLLMYVIISVGGAEPSFWCFPDDSELNSRAVVNLATEPSS